MSASSERWHKWWEYFQQGDLTERELVSDFVNYLDQADIVSQWGMLPSGYQDLVRRYFRANGARRIALSGLRAGHAPAATTVPGESGGTSGVPGR